MAQFVCYTLLTLYMLTTSLPAVEEMAYVVNTSGESLSKINLTTGVVSNNVLTIGSDVFSFPNQIVVRDTLAFVVASGTNEIQIIDLNSETTVGFIPTGTGSNPFWLAFYDDQFAYVTNLLTNSVIKVDIPAGTIIDTLPIGVSPEGIMFTRAKGYVAVSAFNFNTFTYGQGKVVVFDPTADTILTEINVGTNPQYLARDMNGRIHVVCTGDYFSVFGIVYIINPVVDAVLDSIPFGGTPGLLTIAPDNMAYLAAGGWVTSGFMYSYHTRTGQVFHDAANPIAVDSGCNMVVAYQDSSVMEGNFKDFVARLDSSGSEQNNYAVGDGPAHLDFNYVPGDFDGSFQIDVADLTGLVDYIFRGGSAPPFPTWRGNIDGSIQIDVADITSLVEYLFRDGDRPKVGFNWIE